MANINLLPWRETRRYARRQQFLTGLCGTAFIAVLSVWFWDVVVSNQIAYQETRNQKLTTQIKLLDQEVAEIRDLQLQRNRLVDRMRVIQALQGQLEIIVLEEVLQLEVAALLVEVVLQEVVVHQEVALPREEDKILIKLL